MVDTILLIDDSITLLKAMQRVLQREGFHVLTAPSGEEGLRVLARQSVAVVLCDWCMPGMDGLEVLRTIREREEYDDLAVIMVTGRDEPEDVVVALDAGASDYITKPFADAVIRARLRAALKIKITRERLKARNREIIQLSYAMTHDLQAPLASISGAIDVVRAQLGDTGTRDVMKWVDRIGSSAGRMAAILDDLMLYASASNEAITLVPVEVGDVLQGVLDELGPSASDKGVRIQLEGPSATVLADPQGLFRVLTNLIGNGLKYIEDEGNGTVEIILAKNGPMVRISVQDNGPGIPQRQLDEVFLPFKRACPSKPGTGLGLAIVRKYVEAFAGQVWLESDGHSGTTAIVELPAHKGHSAANEAAAAA